MIWRKFGILLILIRYVFCPWGDACRMASSMLVNSLWLCIWSTRDYKALNFLRLFLLIWFLLAREMFMYSKWLFFVDSLFFFLIFSYLFHLILLLRRKQNNGKMTQTKKHVDITIWLFRRLGVLLQEIGDHLKLLGDIFFNLLKMGIAWKGSKEGRGTYELLVRDGVQVCGDVLFKEGIYLFDCFLDFDGFCLFDFYDGAVHSFFDRVEGILGGTEGSCFWKWVCCWFWKRKGKKNRDSLWDFTGGMWIFVIVEICGNHRKMLVEVNIFTVFREMKEGGRGRVVVI